MAKRSQLQSLKAQIRKKKGFYDRVWKNYRGHYALQDYGDGRGVGQFLTWRLYRHRTIKDTVVYELTDDGDLRVVGRYGLFWFPFNEDGRGVRTFYEALARLQNYDIPDEFEYMPVRIVDYGPQRCFTFTVKALEQALDFLEDHPQKRFCESPIIR